MKQNTNEKRALTLLWNIYEHIKQSYSYAVHHCIGTPFGKKIGLPIYFDISERNTELFCQPLS